MYFLFPKSTVMKNKLSYYLYYHHLQLFKLLKDFIDRVLTTCDATSVEHGTTNNLIIIDPCGC